MQSKSLMALNIAAENGDVEAQRDLGNAYIIGEDVEEDVLQAIKWYSKAAEQGDLEAQLNLGDIYRLGGGISADLVEAVDWYHKAAIQGNAIAQFQLGVAYEYGNGIKKDELESVEWYRKAAEQGHVHAQCTLGQKYGMGTDVISKNALEALKWFRKAAEQGDSEAQRTLGLAYSHAYDGDEEEWGVKKDLAEAAVWFRKAATQGDSESNAWLVKHFEYAEQPDDLGFKRTAAENGDISAQISMGVAYELGIGIEKNQLEAVKWYRKAAEQGDVESQRALADIYSENGPAENLVEAAKWYIKAAEQGDMAAQFKLGVAYRNGSGVIKNLATAAEWHRKAAEQGATVYRVHADSFYTVQIFHHDEFDGHIEVKSYMRSGSWRYESDSFPEDVGVDFHFGDVSELEVGSFKIDKTFESIGVSDDQHAIANAAWNGHGYNSDAGHNDSENMVEIEPFEAGLESIGWYESSTEYYGQAGFWYAELEYGDG